MQARNANINRKVLDLERSLDHALQEKQDLESRNCLLHHTMMVNDTHYKDLEIQQVPHPSKLVS